MPPCDRDDVALETRPDAERRHRDPALVRDREHLGHGGRRGGVDDEVGAVRLVEAEVGGVEIALGVAVLDRVRAERLTECLGDIVERRAHSTSDSDGRLAAVRSTAQRRLSCTTRSALSPSCASHAARNSL